MPNAEYRRDGVAAVLVAVCIAVAGLGLRIADPAFGFWGDNAESFAPLWHHVGSELRAGRWTPMDPSLWLGGNVAGEAAYGIVNPVSLLSFVWLSTFEDLALGMAVLCLSYLVLLALGVFALARTYGASRAWAVPVAVAVPLAGFTLFYGASNWASGLLSIAWVTWFFAAGARFAFGRGGPALPVLTGALAVTVGNPYGLLGVLVVLLSLSVQVALSGTRRRLVGLIVIGGCVVLLGATTYLPLISVLDQTSRVASVSVGNSRYLAPSGLDLLALSGPTYLPQYSAWHADHDYVPSVYLAWFVLPLLPWLTWRGARWRELAGPLTMTAIMLALTLGPSELWLFRWPIRFVEYAWASLAALIAVLATPGPARSKQTLRATGSVAAVTVTFLLSRASDPAHVALHVTVTAAALALMGFAVLMWTRRQSGRTTAVLLAGTLLVVPVQVATYSWNHQVLGVTADLGATSDLPGARESMSSYRGTVLQLGAIEHLPDRSAIDSGHLSFGHSPTAIGAEFVGRYTGIGFPAFSQLLCMDYRGGTVCDLRERLASPIPVTKYDEDLVDLLGIDTEVLSLHSYRDLARGDAALEVPAGWSLALRDADRVVLVRDEPTGALVATGSPGVEVKATLSNGVDLSLTVDSVRGGTVLLSRLAWPGYSVAAEADGVHLRNSRVGLLELIVPPGEHNISVTYTPPGLRTGAQFALAGGLLALAHQVLWARGRRNSRDPSVRKSPQERSTRPNASRRWGAVSHRPRHATGTHRSRRYQEAESPPPRE